MVEDDSAVFEAVGEAPQAMPEGPGRTLVWLMDCVDLRRRLESAGLSCDQNGKSLRISLDTLLSTLERLLRREADHGMDPDEEERVQELIWVVRRAKEERGQTHLVLNDRRAPQGPELVQPPEPRTDLAERALHMAISGDPDLLQELEQRWPVADLDEDHLTSLLIPLLTDYTCGPAAGRLLGLLGNKEAIKPLERALLRSPNQEHRLAFITGLGLLGQRDRGIRTLRSMLAHGGDETHAATVDVLTALAEPEHCDILFGMAQLVGPCERCVVASLMYRLGDLRGFQMMELACTQISDQTENSGVVRALEALEATNSTRVTHVVSMLHDRLSSPWCRALANRVSARLARGIQEASPETLLEQAEIAANQDQTEKSLGFVEELLALRPDHQRALYIQAFLYKELDRLDDALRVTQRALETDPNNWQLQRLTGSLHWDIGCGHAALQAYDRAISQQPTDPYSWYYKGYVLYRLKRYKEALPCLERALSLRPDSTFILNQKGFCLEHLGRHRDAVTAYQQAVRLQPQELRTREYLGQALQSDGDLDGALRVFDTILRMSPARETALFQRAEILCEMEEWPEAISAYRAYLVHYSDSFRAWFNCGLCYRHCGRLQEAADCFRRALRLRPESRSARAELEGCLRLLSQ